MISIHLQLWIHSKLAHVLLVYLQAPLVKWVFILVVVSLCDRVLQALSELRRVLAGVLLMLCLSKACSLRVGCGTLGLIRVRSRESRVWHLLPLVLAEESLSCCLVEAGLAATMQAHTDVHFLRLGGLLLLLRNCEA